MLIKLLSIIIKLNNFYLIDYQYHKYIHTKIVRTKKYIYINIYLLLYLFI